MHATLSYFECNIPVIVRFERILRSQRKNQNSIYSHRIDGKYEGIYLLAEIAIIFNPSEYLNSIIIREIETIDKTACC